MNPFLNISVEGEFVIGNLRSQMYKFEPRSCTNLYEASLLFHDSI